MTHRRRSTLLAIGLLATLASGVGVASATAGASASLPGRLAYFSETNDYSTHSTEALVTARPDGSDRQVQFTNAADSFGFPAYSPDGQELAYFQADGSKKASIEVLDLGSRAVTTVFTLSAKGSDVGGIGWTPDGQDLVFGSDQTPTGTAKKNGIWEVPAAGGTPTRLTPLDGAVAPAVAPDGDIYYVYYVVPSSGGSGPSALWEMGADGADAHLVYRTSRAINLPAVAPDGRTVAFSVSTNATTSHVVAIPSQGGRRRA